MSQDAKSGDIRLQSDLKKSTRTTEGGVEKREGKVISAPSWKPPEVKANVVHEEAKSVVLDTSLSSSSSAVDSPAALTGSARPRSLTRPRYSESDDSECNLVIDMDRRPSVEDRVPTPTTQPSSAIAEEPRQPLKSEGEDGGTDAPEVSPPVPAPRMRVSSEDTEGASLLLHLSRSAGPSSSSASPEDTFVLPGMRQDLSDRDCESESILRMLLLDSPEIVPAAHDEYPCTPQRRPPGLSSESRKLLNRDILRYLISQSLSTRPHNHPLSAVEHDVNANFLSESMECPTEPEKILEDISSLRRDLGHLKILLQEKELEKRAVVCYIRFKESLLKNRQKKLASTGHGKAQEWLNGRPAQDGSGAGTSNSQDAPSTSSASLPFQPVPSAPSPRHGDTLPPVSALVSNASGNYGIDMRTVSRGGGGGILKEVLSQRDPPGYGASAARGSPDVRESSFTPGRSPSLPELSPKSVLHPTPYANSSGVSQSPPSLQPERPLATSPFTRPPTSLSHYPLSLVVSSGESRNEPILRLCPASPRRHSPSHTFVPSLAPEKKRDPAPINLQVERKPDAAPVAKRVAPPSPGRFLSPPAHHPKVESPKRPVMAVVGQRFHRTSAADEGPLQAVKLTMEQPPPARPAVVATASASSAPPPSLKTGCNACGATFPTFLCSGCGAVQYCSKECQNLKWPAHGKDCKKLREWKMSRIHSKSNFAK